MGDGNMENYELAIVVSNSNGNVSVYETIDAILNAGFKNVFLEWFNKDLDVSQEQQMRYAREQGLNIIFAHLGYKDINNIWIEGENGDTLLESYKNDIRICKENNISMVILHLIGGNVMPDYNEIGLRRLQELADYAETLDVKIAIENTKRKEYLYYVIDNIKNENVGVCFDSGHYHVFSDDDLDWDRLKDRIFAIHLHDNDQSADLHLLPFEGTLNWHSVVMQLKESNYKGPITLEIHRRGYYADMNLNEFYKKGFATGLWIREMLEDELVETNKMMLRYR